MLQLFVLKVSECDKVTKSVHVLMACFIVELFSIGNFSINEFLSNCLNNVLQQIIYPVQFANSAMRAVKV
jgi:hypothetical protein